VSDFSFADEAKKSRLIIFRRFYKCSSSYKMYVFPGLFIFKCSIIIFYLKQNLVYSEKEKYLL
jgi:hypothetical protein